MSTALVPLLGEVYALTSLSKTVIENMLQALLSIDRAQR